MTEDPREFGLTAGDLRLAARQLYLSGDQRLVLLHGDHGTAVRLGLIRSHLRGLADAIEEEP